MGYLIFTIIAGLVGGFIASYFTTLGWAIGVGFIVFGLLWLIRAGGLDDVVDVFD